MTLPRCPRCEFSYAWDGHNCTHCHLPIPTRASWESFASLVRFDYAHPKRDGRKLALVGCACVRRVERLLSATARATLEMAEALADGAVLRLRRPPGWMLTDTVSQSDPTARAGLAAMHAWQLANPPIGDAGFRDAASNARGAAAVAVFPEVVWSAFPLPPNLEYIRPSLGDPGDLPPRPSRDRFEATQILNRASAEHESRRADRERDEESAQCRIYRDVFGYPFARVEFPQEWRSSTALALARQMYASHDFSGMPILADALQDAGCDHDEILSHCRDAADHVRGCWVADLVLGKS